MSLMTDELENGLIDYVFRGVSFPQSEEIYLGLFSGDPTDEHKSLELVGEGYERELVLFDSPQNGISKNSQDIVFSYAHKEWEEVTFAGLFDFKNGGTLLVRGELLKPVTVTKNKNFVVKTYKLHVGFE